jgi:ADP-ribosylglycohydrolase
MTICIAEALIEAGKEIDPFMAALSRRFVTWLDEQENPALKRAPGNTCLSACRNLKDGVRWDKSGIAASTGCGSAMRSAPIGLYHDRIEKIADFAINSSVITHPHDLATCASVGTALLTRLALNDMSPGCWAAELVVVASISTDFTDIIKLAAQQAAEKGHPDYVLSDHCLGEGWTGHDAVASALFCCMTHPNSYKDAVLLAANTIGDSDSIACIAGAWMGARLGTEGIPKEWQDGIENRDRLIDLADRLYAASLAQVPY